MKLINKIAVSVFLLFQIACSEPYQPVPGGIMINVGSHQVVMTVADNHAFRLGMRTQDSEKAINSIFLDSVAHSQTQYNVVINDHSCGIETSYGRLMLNLDSQKWSLRDPDNNLLIGDGVLVFSDTLQQIGFAAKGRFYGAGNYSSKKLIKTRSSSKMGNGTTDIPYLWNTGGYALFGVTGNDDLPARWKENGKGDLRWTFKGKSADLYLWPASDVCKGVRGLMKLTGQAKLPPLWAFGFLQSRWGWKDRKYIENTLHKFHEKKLPVDAFIFDFEWYTPLPDYAVGEKGAPDFPDFSFNPKLFPDPEKQIAEYHKEGIKLLGIRKPRLGDSTRLVMAHKNNWITASDYNNRDMDFRNPRLRNWYIQKSTPLLKAGIDAWWNDEGEAYYTCYYWWNKAEFDLRAKVRPDSRHFSINRSFSPGNQRFGYCTWNGDLNSGWKNLQETPADLLNWSLSGMFYGSCDIGGFGSKDPDKEIMVRWFQAAVFFPIMRAHSNLFATPHFPWLWDEATIRKALDLRYRLLPYLYSLGLNAYFSGEPVMRPLMMEFPGDDKVANMTDQWLLGKGLMAAPVMNAGGIREVYFPDATWYNFFTGEKIQGPKEITVKAAWDEIPVYVRAGTILPLGPVIENTGEPTDEPLEIRVYPGKNGSFALMEDDGKSYGYMNGQIRKTVFTWDDNARTLSWKVTGTYEGDHVYRKIKVVVGKKEQAADLEKEGRLIF